MRQVLSTVKTVRGTELTMYYIYHLPFHFVCRTQYFQENTLFSSVILLEIIIKTPYQSWQNYFANFGMVDAEFLWYDAVVFAL